MQREVRERLTILGNVRKEIELTFRRAGDEVFIEGSLHNRKENWLGREPAPRKLFDTASIPLKELEAIVEFLKRT